MALLTNTSPLYDVLSKASNTVQDTMENAGVSLNTESKTVELNIQTNAQDIEPVLTQIVTLLNTIESKGGNLREASNVVTEITQRIVQGSTDAVQSVSELTNVFQQLFGTILQSKEVKNNIDELNQSILATKQNLTGLTTSDLNGLKSQLQDISNTAQNSVNNNYSALNQDLKKILTELNGARADIQSQINNQNATINNVSTSLGDGQLRESLSNLFRTNDEIQQSHIKSSQAHGREVEKLNNIISNSGKSTKDAFEFSAKGIADVFDSFDKKIKNVVSNLEQAGQRIQAFTMSVPTSLGAQWLQNAGVSGDIASMLNNANQSAVGQWMLGGLKSVTGIDFTNMQIQDTDINKAVMNLAWNPQNIPGYIGINGYTQQAILNNASKYARDEEKQFYNTMRTAVVRNYATSADTLRGMITDENDLFRVSGGKIDYGALTGNYETFAKAGARSDEDAQIFARYATLAKETRNLEPSDVQNLMKTYYVDMKLSIDDTIQAMEKMNKLSMTSNVPLSELVKSLNTVVETYRQAGISAENAEDVFTHFIEMGFGSKDAQSFATNFASGLQKFSNDQGAVVMSGILQGQGNPFESLFNSQYIDASGEVWARNMASGMDTMLNMTRSMFGDTQLGDYQILKQLQGYGFTQRQSSRIFDQLQSGDLGGLEELLNDTSMKSVEEIEADSNQILKDMYETLSQLGENVGTITQQEAQIKSGTKDQTNMIEELATAMQPALETIFNTEIEKFKIDAEAVTKSLEDKNGLLATITENYKQIERTNSLLASIEGLLKNSPLVLGISAIATLINTLTKPISWIAQKLGGGNIFSEGGFGHLGESGSVQTGAMSRLGGAVAGYAASTAAGYITEQALQRSVYENPYISGNDFDEQQRQALQHAYDDMNVGTSLGQTVGGIAGAINPYAGVILGSATSVIANNIEAGLEQKQIDKQLKNLIKSQGGELTDAEQLLKNQLLESDSGTLLTLLGEYGVTQESFDNQLGGQINSALNAYVRNNAKNLSYNQSYISSSDKRLDSLKNAGIYSQEDLNNIYNNINSMQFHRDKDGSEYYTFGDDYAIDAKRVSPQLQKDLQSIYNEILSSRNADANSYIKRQALFSGDNNDLKNALLKTTGNNYNTLENWGFGQYNDRGEFQWNTQALNDLSEQELENLKAIADNSDYTDKLTEEIKKEISQSKDLQDAMVKLANKDFNISVNMPTTTTTSLRDSDIEDIFNTLVMNDKSFEEVFSHYTTSKDDFLKGSASLSQQFKNERGKIGFEEITYEDESDPSTETKSFKTADEYIREQINRSNAGTVFSVSGLTGLDDNKNMNVTGIVTGNKNASGRDEIIYQIEKNGETSSMTGDIETMMKWAEKINDKSDFKIFDQKLTDLTQIAQQIDDDTSRGADASEGVERNTAPKSSSSMDGWLGQGQLILTNSALHSSSYLSGNTSATVDWDNIRKGIDNAGGGIGLAFNSEGYSRAIYNQGFGGDSYEQRIKTVQSYGNRGGVFNANFNFNGTPLEWTNQMVQTVDRGMNETGVKNVINTNIQTSLIP